MEAEMMPAMGPTAPCSWQGAYFIFPDAASRSASFGFFAMPSYISAAMIPPRIGPHMRSQFTGGPACRMRSRFIPGIVSSATPMPTRAGLASRMRASAFPLALSTRGAFFAAFASSSVSVDSGGLNCAWTLFTPASLSPWRKDSRPIFTTLSSELKSSTAFTSSPSPPGVLSLRPAGRRRRWKASPVRPPLPARARPSSAPAGPPRCLSRKRLWRVPGWP